MIAPTRWMLEALGKNFALPRDRRVIANGRTLHGVGQGMTRKMQAVSAGRLWDEAKNLKVLEAVDSPIPLLIAGETDMSRRAYRSMAGTSGLWVRLKRMHC